MKDLKIIPENDEKAIEKFKIRRGDISESFPIVTMYNKRNWKLELNLEEHSQEFQLSINGVNYFDLPLDGNITETEL